MPTDGLSGWGESARRAGEGFSAALTGATRVMQECAQVKAAGELADFSERLKSIDRETRDELAGQEVQDWNYAWQAASAPKLAEAVNELSPSSRRAGLELAEAYNAKAAVEAQRDYELGKIDKARAQWRNQLENAVQAGDVQQAKEWLKAGQGIFVPEDHLPEESESIASQASLSRWNKGLQEAPLRTLSELVDAPEEELPRQRTDAQRLNYAKRQASRTARQQLLSNLLSCRESGVTPEPDYVKMAVKAGALSEKQAASALAEDDGAAMTLRERRDWLRRVDECEDDEEEAEKLMLDIASARMPQAERKNLLNRVEMCRQIPAQERRSMSRNLWDMYHNGVFGCPGDEAAQQRFAELQQGCLSRLANKEEARQWTRKLREAAENWVCFSTDK